MASFFAGKTIYVNHDKCYKYEILNDNVIQTEEIELSCPNHEEADTKIAFHVFKLNLDACVTIRCSDTDILIIMLGIMSKFTQNLQISILKGTSSNYIKN